MATKFWDTYWKDKGEQELSFWEEPAQEVLELLQSQSTEQRPNVLDLGCGLGRHAIVFAKAGFSVKATDVSETAIVHLDEWSKKLELNIETKICDCLDDDFPAESFDIILSYNVIYHGDRKQFAQAIEHVWNLLKPQGLFFFTCPTREDGKYGYGEKVGPHTFLAEKSITPGDIHYFSNEADLKELLVNFDILSQEKSEGYWNNNGNQQLYSNWNVLAKKLVKV